MLYRNAMIDWLIAGIRHDAIQRHECCAHHWSHNRHCPRRNHRCRPRLGSARMSLFTWILNLAFIKHQSHTRHTPPPHTLLWGGNQLHFSLKELSVKQFFAVAERVFFPGLNDAQWIWLIQLDKNVYFLCVRNKDHMITHRNRYIRHVLLFPHYGNHGNRSYNGYRLDAKPATIFDRPSSVLLFHVKSCTSNWTFLAPPIWYSTPMSCEDKCILSDEILRNLMTGV